MKIFIFLLAVSFLPLTVFSKPSNWKQRNYKLNRNYEKDILKSGNELYTKSWNEPSKHKISLYKNRRKVNLQSVPEYRVKVNYQPARNFLNRDIRFRKRR